MFMKKILLIIAVILTSSCTNKEIIECSLTATADEGIYSNTISATFESNEFTYYVYSSIMEYKTIGDAKEAEKLFSTYPEKYEKMDMIFNYKVEQNIVSVNIEADIKKVKANLGEEEKEYLHADSSKNTFIKELEAEGYTCK